ncbi:hypothetical protein [Hydrogenimonas sp.]
MDGKLKNIDQEAFGKIVAEILDKVVFRHDSAVKRGIDDFKEYLGELHFNDEKKASMFATFMAQVIEATVTPTVSMAAQMVETDAKLDLEKEAQAAQIAKIDEEKRLVENKNTALIYENTYILPVKKTLIEAQRDKEVADVARVEADKLRIDSDKLRIEAQTASINEQSTADSSLKASQKAMVDSQKLSEDKKHATGGVLDKQIALLDSQAKAFDVNKYLKGADSIGQPMGMLITNDVSPSAGMVEAHKLLIQMATGVDLSNYTSVK